MTLDTWEIYFEQSQYIYLLKIFNRKKGGIGPPNPVLIDQQNARCNIHWPCTNTTFGSMESGYVPIKDTDHWDQEK